MSFRMVSMPTGPTSSCSSRRLPSPMPCSPVQVPWSASARLGERGKDSQRGALPHASAPSPSSLATAVFLPAQLVDKGLNPAELLRVFWVHQQDAMEVAIAHVSKDGSWGPKEQSRSPQPSPAPCPPLPRPSSGQAEPVIPEAFMSSLACTRISGSREMGTQTSVIQPCDKGQAGEVYPYPPAQREGVTAVKIKDRSGEAGPHTHGRACSSLGLSFLCTTR